MGEKQTKEQEKQNHPCARGKSGCRAWIGPREEMSVLSLIPCVNSSVLSVHSSVLAGGPPILAG